MPLELRAHQLRTTVEKIYPLVIGINDIIANIFKKLIAIALSAGRPPRIGMLNLKKVMKIISKPATKFGYDSSFWTTSRLVKVEKSELKIRVSRMAIH